ncbi:hypothetical protein SAMN02745216_03402 [Desulfatibacillum alkenivorans DSM 16219]|jgi:hypothetical protein|uniref:Uncharacterized protein n=1 Tax=Desulfatibacillum alkenivorans DSM 16219 TaxID=1121393 RepID=A0A1M6SAD0_9BACT|nr:hypothetical protein SAMN02745216_03402 [Desulfatibacillum alkenivorans DSM 16219]
MGANRNCANHYTKNDLCYQFHVSSIKEKRLNEVKYFVVKF